MRRVGACSVAALVRATIVLALVAATAGCAGIGTSSAPQSGRAYNKIGAPYMIKGVLYTPREQPGYDETGIASWYGPGFHGRKTANGETYNQNDITAAHATLPLPTNVRVTNLDNGRSLVVRVNDRGPFHDGRIIDLSARSAELLGFKGAGTARVRVQVLGPPTVPDFAIAKAEPPPVPMPAPPPPTQPVAKPQEPKPSETVSIAMAPIANPEGELFSVVSELRPIPDPPPKLTSAAMKRASEIAAAAAALLISPAAAAEAPPSPIAAAGYYVQAGTFADSANADALYRSLKAFGRAAIVPSESNGRWLYRVRIGPIASREEAGGILQDLMSRGITDAQVLSE